MAQKHTEGAEGDQHDLVRSHKTGSGSTEMESNCGRPMSPMGQRGLDGDDYIIIMLVAATAEDVRHNLRNLLKNKFM